MVYIRADTNEREKNCGSEFPTGAMPDESAERFVPHASLPTSGASDIVMMTAVSLEDAIRSRRLSCVEVMNAYLDHIENLNPKVNAIVALQDRSGLLAQARERDAQLARGGSMGPLHGFPHAVKDMQPV